MSARVGPPGPGEPASSFANQRLVEAGPGALVRQALAEQVQEHVRALSTAGLLIAPFTVAGGGIVPTGGAFRDQDSRSAMIGSASGCGFGSAAAAPSNHLLRARGRERDARAVIGQRGLRASCSLLFPSHPPRGAAGHSQVGGAADLLGAGRSRSTRRHRSLRQFLSTSSLGRFPRWFNWAAPGRASR